MSKRIIQPDGLHVGRNGRTVIIPGWLIAASSIVGAIFVAGWLASVQFNVLVEEMRWTNYRLCRMEVRDGTVDVWPGCESFRFHAMPPGNETRSR